MCVLITLGEKDVCPHNTHNILKRCVSSYQAF